MPDITMCQGGGCPFKEGCYRYKATPDSYQSFFITPPVDLELYKCKYLWGIKNETKDNR